MSEPLADLADLTDALYQAELAKMQGLAARENKLRADLVKLDQHHKQNLTLPAAQLFAPRHIGADVLWHGWVGRSRTELNQQLALVLAQKSQMMNALRRAHGKHLAANQLLEDAQAKRRKRFNDKRDQQEQSLLLLKPYQG
jgi:small-conductance mechanosensitive channel